MKMRSQDRFCGSFLIGLALLCSGMMFATQSVQGADDSAKSAVSAKAMPGTSPKADTPKADAPKADAPKADAPKADAPKADAPKADAPKAGVQPGAQKANSVQKSVSDYLFVVCVIAILIISLVLSKYFANRWHMLDHQSGYALILFCFLIALFSTVFGLVGHRLNLGIDLRGGSILVYSVSPNVADNATHEEVQAANKNEITNQQMGELKSALARRINPSGVREISIQELGNNSEVKITIPEADESEVARIERIINSSGQLKFRILASQSAPEEKELIDKAMQMKEGWSVVLPKPIGKDGIILGGTWTPVDPSQMDCVRAADLVLRDSHSRPTDPNMPVPLKDVLVLDLAPLYDVNGRHMAAVREGVGDRGAPVVFFTMNTEGAERMQHLTERYKAGSDREFGRLLGIVMNDSLYSAPTIRATISRSGEITFGNELGAENRVRIQKEVRDLIQVINAGVLPAKLSDIPVSSMVTGPTLGADTIEKGKNSILWAAILVLLFMIAYYGFAGVVASFAVVMNLLLIMACMLGLRAAFTLPGLAGLALTVGMAVDANILIFERIKEELNNGATLRMAIRNGFQRAFSAIVDSNVTTMLTAVILYAVVTEQIKGFAVTLFLGVGFSMFTATCVSRHIFETAEHCGWIGNRCVFPILPGLRPIAKTNFNFMGKRKIALMIANIIIILGLIGVVLRGKGIFDIDFVGGVEVQTVFKKPQEISQIREKLKELPDLSVSNLSLAKDRAGNPVQPNTFFTICTSCPPGKVADQYRDEVETILKRAFGEDLRHYTLGYKLTGKKQFTVPGTEGQMEDRITLDLTIDPPMSAEVIRGYVEDHRNKIIETKKMDPQLTTTMAVHVTNPKFEAGEKEKPYGNWSVSVTSDDQSFVDEIMKAVVVYVNEKQTFEASNTIGSSVAGYARTQGMLAILGSLICIILYIWVRFTKIVFGLASVIALVYNVLIALGAIAVSYWLAPYLGFLGISEFKIGLPTIAAFLTIIGYSLNDTIVLFDRIREVCGKSPRLTETIINTSINQTLSRTVLTSVTTFFVAAILYFFGGASIHTFAFTMCLGVFFGTLGTIFVASSWLLWLVQFEGQKKLGK